MWIAIREQKAGIAERMKKSDQDQWRLSKELAKTLLRDRQSRRRGITLLLGFVLAMLVLGLWPFADWLEEGLWRFAGWWLVTGGGTVLLALAAIYDLLCCLKDPER